MIRVPLKTLAPLCGDVTASLYRPIRSDAHALGLLWPYVRAIQDSASTPDLQRMVVTHVHDLLALLIGATRDGAEVAQGRGLAAARLNAVKADIARNLDHDDISIGAIAKRHQVTPRYIQLLFEQAGTTFMEHVTAQRLDRAHRMLGSARHKEKKIAAIAAEAGFRDLSHFNRLFRRRYGASPSDMRALSDTSDGKPPRGH
jgi:transcriptional regulator GlxA family with amidase domain